MQRTAGRSGNEGFYLVREQPLELCRGSAAQAAGSGWEVEAGRPRGRRGHRWNAHVNAWLGDGWTRAGAAGGEEGKTTGFPGGLDVGAHGEGSQE